MKTILVVDDFASVRFYHQSLLKQAGYTTLAARDGNEAIALLEQHPVDLVMLDMIMPNMNGNEFMQRVRSNPRFAKLPVLIISTEAQPELDSAAHAGAGFGVLLKLHKPILPDALLEEVRRLIE
jgi:two-component system, chemotaxis family, chemotaxis protein CheY